VAARREAAIKLIESGRRLSPSAVGAIFIQGERNNEPVAICQGRFSGVSPQGLRDQRSLTARASSSHGSRNQWPFAGDVDGQT
jgi:hypothetical protein